MSDLSTSAEATEATVMGVLRRAARAGRAWRAPSELARATGLDCRAVDRALRRLATDGEVERWIQEIDHKLVAGWRAVSVSVRLEEP